MVIYAFMNIYTRWFSKNDYMFPCYAW